MIAPSVTRLAAAALSGLLLLAPAASGVRAQDAGEAPPPPERSYADPMPGAVLQGLDKVTARISTFTAPVGEEVGFGTLRITARTCHKKPPTEPPESAAFLEIEDEGLDGTRRQIFSGWMFASSPALSAMQHAVYDVWVVDCMKASSSAEDSSG